MMWLKPHSESPYLLTRVNISSKESHAHFVQRKVSEAEYHRGLRNTVRNSKRIKAKEAVFAELDAYRDLMMDGVYPTPPAPRRRSTRIHEQNRKDWRAYDFRWSNVSGPTAARYPWFDWRGMVFVDANNLPQIFAFKVISSGIKFGRATVVATGDGMALEIIGSVSNAVCFKEGVAFLFSFLFRIYCEQLLLPRELMRGAILEMVTKCGDQCTTLTSFPPTCFRISG